MSIPRQLLTYINSGKCFALIGSGLSSAMQYPSWWQMARDAAALLASDNKESGILATLIEQKDYPEVFQRVADRLGGVSQLLEKLTPSFAPKIDAGEAYQLVCRWPIRCYMTTNYDDEISSHLRRIGQHFTTLGNRPADMAQIRGDTQRRVVKLHGDLAMPDDIVLTTSQYKEFETGGPRQYFRHKLISIFQMVPVMVVGHSITDRDLQLVLQLAKESASPDNPIFMIVADAPPAEIEKLYREYNIRLLSYPNPRGSNHRNLLQLLRQINRFVVPRTADDRRPLDFPDAKEAEVAVSLYVHASLRFGSDGQLLQRAVQPQVLTAACDSACPLNRSELIDRLTPESLRNAPSLSEELEVAIKALTADKLVEEDVAGIRATRSGIEAVAAIRSERAAEEDQVFGALRARLSAHGSGGDVETLIGGLKDALVTVFRRRGLAAAELLFRENPFEPADMPELFDAVFPPGASVTDFSLRAEYCEAVMDLLTKPNDDQKRYLAHLAQGFFAYHMFGLDPEGREVRQRLVQGTAWLLDSNILMPIVAKHSTQWEFLTNLLGRMAALGITPITTPKLVAEVDKALSWMKRQLHGAPDGDERETVLRVIKRPDYSENPFIDGFIVGYSAGDWRSLSEFMRVIGHEDGGGVRNAVQAAGIQIVDPQEVLGDEFHVESDDLANELFAERERAGTLRGGDIQVKAEAEAMLLVRHIRRSGFRGDSEANRAFFVSTSKLLDIMYRAEDGLITWFPETLFKHLSHIDPAPLDADAVFHAITTSYYTVGVSIIDEPAYKKYFRPSVSEASTTLKQEIGAYTKAISQSVALEQVESESILKRFEHLDDLDKPQYVSQLGWLTARRAEARVQVAEQARAEAERRHQQQLAEIKSEYDRKARDRRRHEERRLHNLSDTKHQRKRLRQAKKRKKKGK